MGSNDDRSISKVELLEAMKTARANWESLLSEVRKEDMLQPGVEGELSVKDIIAHVTWYERETVGMLQKRSLAVGSDLWYLEQEERNAGVYRETSDLSLESVLSESTPLFRQLVEEVEALDEEDLTDPRRFREMPEDWQPWKVIAGNSYEHYPDHIVSIRAWLGTKALANQY